MIGFLIFVSIIIVISAVASVIYYFSLFKKEDEPEERAKVTNSMPKYTNGYKEGVLIRVVEQGDWSAVEFFPRDINYNKLKKEKKKIKQEVVFVPSNILDWIQKGGWSKEVSELIINPISEEDIPSGLKNTSMGDGFKISTIKGERERVEKRIDDIVRESIEKIQKNTKGEKVFERFLELEKGIRENIVPTQTKPEDKK